MDSYLTKHGQPWPLKVHVISWKTMIQFTSGHTKNKTMGNHLTKHSSPWPQWPEIVHGISWKHLGIHVI